MQFRAFLLLLCAVASLLCTLPASRAAAGISAPGHDHTDPTDPPLDASCKHGKSCASPTPEPTGCFKPPGAVVPSGVMPTLPPGLITDPNDPSIAAAIAAGEAQAAASGYNPASPGPLPTMPPGITKNPCPNVDASNLAARIFAAAMAFRGSRTCGLHGAPGDNACMASVNQILINAGVRPIGSGLYGTNSVPDAVVGSGAGRLLPIPPSDTVPGDIMVRHSPGETYSSYGGEEHITVCEVRGCSEVISNHSTGCIFSWESDYTLCYTGSPYCGGYSDYYRVVP